MVLNFQVKKITYLPTHHNNYESRDSKLTFHFLKGWTNIFVKGGLHGLDLRPPNIETTDKLNSSVGGHLYGI
jgi:hypothetical protein